MAHTGNERARFLEKLGCRLRKDARVIGEQELYAELAVLLAIMRYRGYSSRPQFLLDALQTLTGMQMKRSGEIFGELHREVVGFQESPEEMQFLFDSLSEYVVSGLIALDVKKLHAACPDVAANARHQTALQE